MATLDASAEHTWPDTLAIMGWSVDPEGFGVIFDRSIPAFAAAKLRGGMETLLARHGRCPPDQCRAVRLSPGRDEGRRGDRAFAATRPGRLSTSEREVLRKHGNMSAPTALFVLKRVLERGDARTI